MITKILHSLGLTKEHSYELSDILSEETKVIDKTYRESYNHPYFDPATCTTRFKKIPEKYTISIQGENTSFVLNDKSLYEKLSLGGNYTVDYKEVYKITRDYESPNFIRKKIIEVSKVKNNLVKIQC